MPDQLIVELILYMDVIKCQRVWAIKLVRVFFPKSTLREALNLVKQLREVQIPEVATYIVEQFRLDQSRKVTSS